jgi:prepilin-type N-terminal cleavage/methylation domain-containing protein
MLIGIQRHVTLKNSSTGLSFAGYKLSSGFTLIEMVITIVLIAIISSIAAMIILQGVKTYSLEDSRSNAHYQARLAMERMAREIRQIRSESTTDIQTMTAADLKFTNVAGATVEFTWATPNLNLSANRLASGITAFTFKYYLVDGTTQTADRTQVWFVEINMTAQQGTETLQMNSRVHPMNFY